VREKERIMEGGQWATLTMDACSYQVFLRDSNTLVVRCPIHKIGMQTVGEVKDGIGNYRREEKLQRTRRSRKNAKPD
jgi:hypothetical protein